MYNDLKTSTRMLHKQTVVKLVNLVVRIILNGAAQFFVLFHILPLGGSIVPLATTVKELLGTWLRAKVMKTK